MKTAKSLLIKFCAAAAMLVLANQSQALTTPYLIQLSNQVAGYHAVLSTIPEASKETRALARALRDLSRPPTPSPRTTTASSSPCCTSAITRIRMPI